MAIHQPVSLTAHPSPPFRPNSPTACDSTGSRLQGRLSTIRSWIAREQISFSNAKVNHKAVEERVERLRRHDEEDMKQTVTGEATGSTGSVLEDGGSDTSNPSTEATR